MNSVSNLSKPLLLASSSIYRREILAKLKIPFEWASPEIDETTHDNEQPETLVRRLSLDKCNALKNKHPGFFIIGSDQIATIDGQILTKPGTRQNAIKQLLACSGKRVLFLTGLTVLDSSQNQTKTIVEPFEVLFRDLKRDEIEYYVESENPLDCAGSFKAEGLGIALFHELRGRDPNSLIGLPLIALIDLLHEFGVGVLSPKI